MIVEVEQIGWPVLDLQNRETLVRMLRVNYWIMKASEDLLEDAIKHSSGALLEYFKSHIEEERGHAEWMLDDLDGDAGSADMIVAACAGAQYYLIRHVHPAAMLGYMAVLEGYPMSRVNVEKLEEWHGKKLLRTLRYHAEHDIDHNKDLLVAIENAPEWRQLITDNAVQTMRLVRYALEN